jgi:hypothetical protein
MAKKSKTRKSKNHGPSIKNDRQYERIREQGASKEKAARIANTGRKTASKRGGKAPKYEDWSREDLYQKAKKVGIEGRSRMKKDDLIDALRNH